jgi:hypothetical protein
VIKSKERVKSLFLQFVRGKIISFYFKLLQRSLSFIAIKQEQYHKENEIGTIEVIVCQDSTFSEATSEATP